MTKQRLDYVLLFVACIISNLSYYPIFQSTSYFRYLVIFLWLIVGVMSLQRSIVINLTLKRVIFLYGLFVFANLITSLVNNVNAFQNHFFSPVTIAMMIFVVANIVGRRLQIRDIKHLCCCYMYVMMIISVCLFFFYLSDTDIYVYNYQYTYGKNEMAVLLMCFVAIACSVFQPKNIYQELVRIVGMSFGVLDIFLLKCRTAMFAIVLIFFLTMILGNNIQRRLRKIIFFVCILIGIILYIRVDIRQVLVEQFVFANREMISVDSISSGRITQIEDGIKIFFENFIVGVGISRTLDCSFISLLMNYGICAIPVITLSLYPMTWALFNLRKQKNCLALCFFFLTCGMFVVSCLEELAPFGPGTRCYFLWLLWGLLLGNNDKQMETNKNETNRKR